MHEGTTGPPVLLLSNTYGHMSSRRHAKFGRPATQTRAGSRAPVHLATQAAQTAADLVLVWRRGRRLRRHEELGGEVGVAHVREVGDAQDVGVGALGVLRNNVLQVPLEVGARGCLLGAGPILAPAAGLQ